MKCLAIISFLLLLVTPAAFGQGEYISNNEHAQMWGAYRDARLRDDLQSAERVLIGEIIRRSPGAKGEYAEASRLFYELGRYQEARVYWRKYTAMGNRREETHLLNATDDCYEELLFAALQKRAPRWNFLKASYPDLKLLEIMDIQFQMGLGSWNYKLAAAALAELEKLNPGPHIIKVAREHLAQSLEAHEAYKRQVKSRS